MPFSVTHYCFSPEVSGVSILQTGGDTEVSTLHHMNENKYINDSLTADAEPYS